MKDAASMVEYGVAIDPRTMIEPIDPAQLELEAGHPGLGDASYVQRRKELFALCRRHRLNRLGPPLVEYTSEETRIWREVSPKLDELHRKHACQIYLKAKDALGISATEIPQLRTLSDRVKRETNMHLVPAEGPLAYRTFYSYIAERGFPVTQFIRHGSHPEFTPEPDMIHDCLGHVPPLMNRDYAEVLTLIGKAAFTTPDPLQVLALKRFSWFSIEFGLIEEDGETQGVRGWHPVVHGRDSVFAFLQRCETSAVRDRRGDRNRLRPVAHAGSAFRHPVVCVSAARARELGATDGDCGVVVLEILMGSETMGRVVVKVRIESLRDLYALRNGDLTPEQVRTVEVDEALVDTGATMLSLPKSLIKRLDLKKFTTRRMRTAKGTAKFNIYDAVRLTIQGRDCTIDVSEVPEDCPVLIGQVALEMLDFIVDPKRQKLIGNPEHGGKFMHDMF